MGYLEIIGIGYLFNIASYGLAIMVAVLNMVVAVLFGSKMQLFEQGKILKKLQVDYYDLKPQVPKGISMEGEDLAIFFPFMQVLTVFKFLFFSVKYGMNSYLIMKMEQKIYIMERWIKENKEG